MTTQGRVNFKLLDSGGVQRGSLFVSTLPSGDGSAIAPLVELADVDAGGLETIQLLEGCEYLYEIDAPASVEVDTKELFAQDDKTGKRGRLRTRLYTGRVEVRVALGSECMRPIAFEVRSSKLGYLDDYRWMLEDIAELGSSLVLERFAPNSQRLITRDDVDAETLYQRFVFLRGIITSERLDASLRRIVSEPYIQWRTFDEQTSPSRGLRSTGRLSRELLRPGARQEWPHSPHAALATLPRQVSISRTEETLDNVPNRFVLFALRDWQALIADIVGVLEAEVQRDSARPSPAAVRGLREAAALTEYLSEFEQAPVFRDVGPLTDFPISNQVLQKKEGYREVLHAYILLQLGAELAWQGGEEVFGGGQRNVATLYEYWVFLELAKIVSRLCSTPLDLASLVTESSTGLHLLLRREKAHTVKGRLNRHGREFDIELCFNQQFSPGTNGTWTRTLRPDCSLHIVPLDRNPPEDDIWLHFDAKYRVSQVSDMLGDDQQVLLEAKTDDLYKMHTYRDAIIRAAGAYVVFPGTQALTRHLYEEVLPGLGAFPLRPSAGAEAQGSEAIRDFLDRAFEHVATQTTRHERSRYWQRATRGGPKLDRARPAAPFLDKPPADTSVLLGYVRSPEHHQWIAAHGRYNLRADRDRSGAVGLRGPEFGAELLVLYGNVAEFPWLFRIVDEPLLLTGDELVASGYPRPGGHLYFCLQLKPISPPPAWLQREHRQSVASALRGTRPVGHPIVTDWLTLAKNAP